MSLRKANWSWFVLIGDETRNWKFTQPNAPRLDCENRFVPFQATVNWLLVLVTGTESQKDSKYNWLELTTTDCDSVPVLPFCVRAAP